MSLRDQAGLERLCRDLAARDPDIARALDLGGMPQVRAVRPGFEGLVRLIVDQQVSVAAGTSIWRKLETALGAVTPEAVAAGSEGLTACGLSRAKARYALGLAEAVLSGTLDLDSLETQEDDEVRARLIALPGIGPWTAELHLMFALGRSDVFPAGDLVLRAALHDLKALPSRPDIRTAEMLAEPWRPLRSVAALILWRYVGARRAALAPNPALPETGGQAAAR